MGYNIINLDDSGGGGSNSFTIMQPDAGTAPTAESATDTLTFTSSDASITITGNSTTDTLDFKAAGGGGDVVGPASSVDNAIARFSGATGKIIQDYTSSAPTITDAGVPSFKDASYAGSERIGAGSSVGSTDTTTIGYLSLANGSGSVSIGKSAKSYGLKSVGIGNGAYASGSYAFALGANTFTNNMAYAVCLGANARADTTHSFNLGGAGGEVNFIFLGEGEKQQFGAHNDVTIRPTRPYNKTDIPGGDLILLGAGSTGTAVGSSVKIQTQTGTSATGSTENTTWEDMFEARGDGEIILNAEDSATADGSLWANSLSFYLDESGNTVTVKAKYADGSTIKTGTIALT